jgi:hypothetical protein
MPSVRTSLSNKPRRIPRKGCFFTVVRVSGLLLSILGFLLLAIGTVGFFVVLVQIGPMLVEMIQHLEQKMAGFVFFTSLAYPLFFMIVGLVGAIMAGIGLFLGYMGTELATLSSTTALGQAQNVQHEEPPPTSSA